MVYMGLDWHNYFLYRPLRSHEYIWRVLCLVSCCESRAEPIRMKEEDIDPVHVFAFSVNAIHCSDMAIVRPRHGGRILLGHLAKHSRLERAIALDRLTELLRTDLAEGSEADTSDSDSDSESEPMYKVHV